MKKFIFMVVFTVIALSSVVNAQNSTSVYYSGAIAETASPHIESELNRNNAPTYGTQERYYHNTMEQDISSVPPYLIQQQRLEKRYNRRLSRISEESSGYKRHNEQTQQGVLIGAAGLLCSNDCVEIGSVFSLRAGYVYKGMAGYIEYSNRNFEKYYCYNGNYIGLGFEADAYRYKSYSVFFGGYTNVGKISSSQDAKDTIDAYLGDDNTYPKSATGVTAGFTIGGKVYFGNHAFASIAFDASKTNYNARFMCRYFGEYNTGVKLAFGFIL